MTTGKKDHPGAETVSQSPEAPVENDRSVAKAAIARLRALREETKPVSRAEIAAWIKEGRR